MSDIILSLLIISITIGLLLGSVSNIMAADFNAVGDIGCKSPAISILRNLAGKPISFFGVGDYSYKCSSGKILPLWQEINSKKGVMGNHECEKNQDSLKAGTLFGNGGCKKGFFAYVRGGDTAIIGLNPYTAYKKDTPQYNFVLAKTALYKTDNKIHWIIYIIHPLFYPVCCTGNHCHGIDEPKFNAVYEPIIKSSGKAIIVQAHTHLTATGSINNIPSLICGGGGEDSTTAAGLNGYSFVTSQPVYCHIHTELGKATATLIGTTNQTVHIHNWINKN